MPLKYVPPSQVPKLIHKCLDWESTGKSLLHMQSSEQKACENIYHTGHTAPTRHTPTSSLAATSHHLHLLQQHHLGASYCLFSF